MNEVLVSGIEHEPRLLTKTPQIVGQSAVNVQAVVGYYAVFFFHAIHPIVKVTVIDVQRRWLSAREPVFFTWTDFLARAL